MLKPAQLRKALTDAVPVLQTSPDTLRMFVDNGRIVSTLGSSLSFEYQYQIELLITDFAHDCDLIIVPILAWLREHQPDIMATSDKQQTGYKFKADMLNDGSYDIAVYLQLTERVIVKQVDAGLHVEHFPEPPLPEPVERPRELYLHGELVSQWHE
ncbi:phage tail protein [Rahnella variigena]|uniref:phage tail protein n=1 Tax=Rahnella variigena TaxID=574964 RepID=UPI0024480FEA|nr:phage tail protein [Rahnella variigena]MDH2899202.1 phage tail protein [Rahnella variigena]